MKFTESRVPGAWIIDITAIHDDRGFFAMTWLPDQFRKHGIDPALAQCNLAFNHKRGTLRGMHFQAAPEPDAKLVRCLSGRMFDVAVDIRPGSPTRGRWAAVELAAGDGRSLFVPAGFAHGFVTLEDDTTVFYMMGAAYRPALARGFRWDDPRVAIAWPVAPQTISERDRALPALDDLDEAELAR